MRISSSKNCGTCWRKWRCCYGWLEGYKGGKCHNKDNRENPCFIYEHSHKLGVYDAKGDGWPHCERCHSKPYQHGEGCIQT